MHTVFLLDVEEGEEENVDRKSVLRETETKTKTKPPTKSIILYSPCSIVNCLWLFTFHRLMQQLHSISVIIPSLMHTETHFYANIIFMLFSLSNNKAEKRILPCNIYRCATIPCTTVWMTRVYNGEQYTDLEKKAQQFPLHSIWKSFRWQYQKHKCAINCVFPSLLLGCPTSSLMYSTNVGGCMRCVLSVLVSSVYEKFIFWLRFDHLATGNTDGHCALMQTFSNRFHSYLIQQFVYIKWTIHAVTLYHMACMHQLYSILWSMIMTELTINR